MKTGRSVTQWSVKSTAALWSIKAMNTVRTYTWSVLVLLENRLVLELYQIA